MTRALLSLPIVVAALLLAGCTTVSHTASMSSGDGATTVTVGGSGERVVGSGRTITERRTISGISRIRFESAGALHLLVGPQEGLEIEADDNILPLLTSDASSSALTLGVRPRSSFTTSTPIVYRLTVASLEAVEVAGSGSLEAAGIDSDRLRVTISGIGSAKLAGVCRSAELAVSGSGDLDASALAAQTLSAEISGIGGIVVNARGKTSLANRGSGSITGTVDSDDLDAALSGIGSIALRGRAERQAVRLSGSGNYRGDGLASIRASVAISGIGEARVRVAEALDASISGSGTVRYAGTPIVTTHITGIGSVERL
jgi:hypothetical protein